MKNPLLFITLAALTICTFLSCSKNPTSNTNENIYGSIFVDVRALQYKSMLFYGDGSKDIPRDPVLVDLKVMDELTSSLITIKSRITDSQGFTSFDSLENGFYYVYPRPTADIGYVRADSCEVNVKNLEDTVRVGIAYHWNLSQHDFEIEIDSTILNPDSLQLHQRIYFLYNNGVDDTLFCEFDTTEVPQWLYFEINKIEYIPMYPPTPDHWIHIFFWSHETPVDEIPMVFTVPVTHQFATEYLKFNIVFRSQL